MNIVDYIGDDGNFSDGFKGAAIAELGDDFKETKVFDDIKNPSGLISAYAHTKTKVGEKLEGVIQKPAENATDQEKADYQKSLLKELGTPEKAEDYDFPRPENLPEGMNYDEDTEAAFRQFFFEQNVPKGIATALAAKFSEMQISRHTAAVEAQQKEFDTACTELDKDWSGTAATKNNRLVFKAIMEFADEGLTKLLKDAKLNDNITDHQKWNDCSFTPAQRRVWLNIAKRTKVDTIVTNEGGSGGGEKESDTKKVVKKLYDHPTSVEARKHREG